MIPATQALSNQLKGDTFNGARFTLSPVTDLTGASIQTQFRRDGKTNPIQKDIAVGTGITVEDLANGVFVWDAFIIDWTVGTYHWDVQITFADTSVKTYIEGTIKVVQDTTY